MDDLIIRQRARIEAYESQHEELTRKYNELEQILMSERQEAADKLSSQAAELDEQRTLNGRLRKELGLLKSSVEVLTPKAPSKMKRERDEAMERAEVAERALAAETKLTFELNQEKLELQQKIGALESALSPGVQRKATLISAKKSSLAPTPKEEQMAAEHAAQVEAMKATLQEPDPRCKELELKVTELTEQMRANSKAHKVRMAELKTKYRAQVGVISELKLELETERKLQEEASINRSLQLQHATILARQELAAANFRMKQLEDDYAELEDQYSELEEAVEISYEGSPRGKQASLAGNGERMSACRYSAAACGIGQNSCLQLIDESDGQVAELKKALERCEQEKQMAVAKLEQLQRGKAEEICTFKREQKARVKELEREISDKGDQAKRLDLAQPTDLKAAYMLREEQVALQSKLLGIHIEGMHRTIDENNELEAELTAVEQNYGLNIMANVVHRWMNCMTFQALKNWMVGAMMKELKLGRDLMEIRLEELEETLDRHQKLEDDLTVTEQNFCFKIVAYVIHRWTNALTFRLLRNWKLGATSKELEVSQHLLEVRRYELQDLLNENESLESALTEKEQRFCLRLMANIIHRWSNSVMYQTICNWKIGAVVKPGSRKALLLHDIGGRGSRINAAQRRLQGELDQKRRKEEEASRRRKEEERIRKSEARKAKASERKKAAEDRAAVRAKKHEDKLAHYNTRNEQAHKEILDQIQTKEVEQAEKEHVLELYKHHPYKEMKAHLQAQGVPSAEVNNCLGKWELTKLAHQHDVKIPEDPLKMKGGSWFKVNKRSP